MSDSLIMNNCLKSYHSKMIIWCLILISFLLALYIQWPALLNPWCVQNDARIHIWWMKPFQNQEIFKHDKLMYMMASKSWRNFGFVLLFKIVARWIEPVFLSKILSVVLLPVTVGLLFLTGKSIRNKECGFVAGSSYLALCLHSWSSGICIFDGLQRSFRDPIVIAFLWGLATNSQLIIIIACIFGLFFYPVTIPIIIVMSISYHLFYKKSLCKHKGLIILILLGIFISFLTCAWVIFKDKPFYGYNGSIFDNPTFNKNGREPIFSNQNKCFGIPEYLFVSKSGGFFGNTKSESIVLLWLLWLCISMALSFRIFRLPDILETLFLSSLICFIIAWLLAIVSNRFLAYFPSRYSMIILITVLWLGFLSTKIREAITRRNFLIFFLLVSIFFLYQHINEYSYIIFTIVLLAFTSILLSKFLKKRITFPAIMAVSFLTPQLFFIERTPGYIVPESWEIQMIQIIKKLPVDAIIAGPPGLLNNVPIHSERSVFVNFEMDTEMQEDWARQRFTDFFSAYYAESFEELTNFCQKNNIEYLVIDLRFFSPEFLAKCIHGKDYIYFEPHNMAILEHIKGRKSFFLSKIPEDQILFRYGPFFLCKFDRELSSVGR